MELEHRRAHDRRRVTAGQALMMLDGHDIEYGLCEDASANCRRRWACPVAPARLSREDIATVIDPATPDALIFDMDSLLARTMPVWREAESHLLELLGDRYSEEWVSKYRGMNAADVAAVIHGVLGPAMPLAECQRILRDKLVEVYGRMGPDAVQPMPGSVELVTRLAPTHRMVVASGSPEDGIHAALERLGISRHFEAVVSSEAVERGKPEPDVFLAAARMLGAEPRRCLVFEDSLAGVRAARAAGMACFAVPSEARDEIARLATRVFDSLGAISDDDVAAALGC